MKRQARKSKGTAHEIRAVDSNREAWLANESGSRFNSALIDIVPALLLVLDPEGRIVRFNRFCQELTGFGAGEVEGRQIWDALLAPESVGEARAGFRSLLEKPVPGTFEGLLRCKNGEHRLICWHNTPVIGTDSVARWFIAFGTDVTDQQKNREALETSLKDLADV